MDSVFKFENGTQMRDRITGFRGTVTGRADYLTGCKQYCLSPPAKDDGSFVDGHWFDEDRMVVVAERAVESSVETPGGPEGSAPTK